MEDINRIRILKAAHHLFNTRGYRNVTVQDLAAELGMSKKTIYLYFDGKEQIAAVVLEETIKNISMLKSKAEANVSNPLHTLKDILLSTEHESVKLGPLFLMDIEKYLPELADKYKRFRLEGKGIIKSLLKDAQDLGLITRDIPIELIMEIMHESLGALAKPDFLSQQSYSMSEVRNTFINIYLRGITTEALNSDNR